MASRLPSKVGLLVRTRKFGSFLILLLVTIISAPTTRAADLIEFRNGFWINLHH